MHIVRSIRSADWTRELEYTVMAEVPTGTSWRKTFANWLRFMENTPTMSEDPTRIAVVDFEREVILATADFFHGKLIRQEVKEQTDLLEDLP